MDGTDGVNPVAGVTLDADGNIFGTTEVGGSNSGGTVFEIKAGTTTATTLYSFNPFGNGSEGFNPLSGVTIDSANNIFGTTQNGGQFGKGTVWEIAAGTTTATTLYSFGLGGTDGANPVGGVTLDSAGDLFGTTSAGGLNNDGTVWELLAGTPVATTLYSFNGTDGATPTAGVALDSAGNIYGTTSAGGSSNLGTIFKITTACYRAGTLIQTDQGEVPVEALRIDDTLVTLHDGPQSIIWVGHRRIDCRRHPEPTQVLPVRVEAGAFGPDLPMRDLYLSPDHAVYAENVLVPVKYLINGTTIAQIDLETVDYYHIELRHHAVILAEGLPAESYLDTGDRRSFANAAVVDLHPAWGSERQDATIVMEALGVAPLCVVGPAIDRLRKMLDERALAPQQRAFVEAA